MDTITAIHTRRSIRDYEARAVERAIITDILFDAAQAPTTPVSGPFLFHVIEGAARIADYGARAKQYAREHRPDAVGYSWFFLYTASLSVPALLLLWYLAKRGQLVPAVAPAPDGRGN